MTFNSDKFECLRYWPSKNKPAFSYKSPDGTIIEEKQHLRDLGVEMSCDLSFTVHIENTVASCHQTSWLGTAHLQEEEQNSDADHLEVHLPE